MATKRTQIKPKNPAVLPVSIEHITDSILLVRGHKVLLDGDLAVIYGVSTGRLNEAIKRNINRFPQDFMFQLTSEEATGSRSQIAILKNGRGTNIKYLPYVFTEHGAIQAANVLRSEQAVEMGIHVVRAFVQLRNLLASNKELSQKLNELERKLRSHDQAIVGILKTIRQLMNPPSTPKRSIGFVDLQERKK
jgi:aromatic ring-opening dioxygenase LigB subunit